jgi:predicted ABC-type ATPase
MGDSTPRMRMFAGPNGSGKSTIKDQLPQKYFSRYINPDLMERDLKTTQQYDFSEFDISVTTDDLRRHLISSSFWLNQRKPTDATFWTIDGSRLKTSGNCDSYDASVISDFFRHQLLKHRRSFTFETVMSSPDKVELMQYAQSLGYRTYLYFVCTQSVEINIARIGVRLSQGGHGVPENKVRERYLRSLNLLSQASKLATRGFYFDTSNSTAIYLARSADGSDIDIYSDTVPAWFQTYLLDRF